MKKATNMVDAITLVSVRASKVRSLCIGAREALENMPPLQDERAREWAIVGQDLINVMDDELSFLLEEVRQAEKMALQKPETIS